MVLRTYSVIESIRILRALLRAGLRMSLRSLGSMLVGAMVIGYQLIFGDIYDIGGIG